MADFCRGCLIEEGFEELADRNDFQGIVNPGDLSYFVCEGCGVHLFDHRGVRQCSSVSWYTDPEKMVMFDCPECKEIAQKYRDRLPAEEPAPKA